jgi:hypothetical protein
MKTIHDFTELLKTGCQPVVEFKTGIDDKESYAEAGMRAQAVCCSTADSDGVLRIAFSFSAFDEHNKPFESANYYDRAGNPRLTAREAGYYKETVEVYFDHSEPLDKLFTVLDESSTGLFAQYKASGYEGSYVQWLEQRVNALTASATAPGATGN